MEVYLTMVNLWSKLTLKKRLKSKPSQMKMLD